MLQFLKIGASLSIPLFNLFVGGGIALGMLLLQWEKHFKRLSEEEKHTIHLGLLLSIGIGFIGALFFDSLTQGTAFSFDNLSANGLTFFGGFVSGTIFLCAYLYFKRMSVISTLGILTPSFCIAHSIGRIGCFFAGCCFGTPTDSPFGVIFPVESVAYNHYHSFVSVHPTQLYESAFVLILFFFIISTQIEKRFFIYIISYCSFRFIIEFIRADDRGTILEQTLLSPSQVVSVSIVLLSLLLILINKRNTHLTL